ncbi:MAG: efflux RND transporter permease subunit [Spirochaetaceae bacterium]|jgi:multidrug efflux pump subunit AcrB|nr:efflux RND transporter permease subunit [Spirochaetaceae bacterium]
MRNFITLCICRPVTIIMFLSALIAGALFFAVKLPLDKLPDISSPSLNVETVYEGMSAGDIRSIITIPVEDALAPLKGLERIKSISRDGASLISLDFRWGTDPANAAALTREALDMVYPSLPDGAEKPLVSSGVLNNSPHMILALRSKHGDAVFERRFADYEMRARLRRIDGSGEIIVSGGKLPETQIKLDSLKAISRGINSSDFVRIIAAETQDLPAGKVKDGDKELVVINKGRPSSLRELSSLIISDGNGPLKVSDIAELREGSARQKSIFVFDGKEQLALEIYRRPGANPVQLSSDIRRLVNEVNDLFTRDILISIVYDDSPSIIESLKNLALSTLVGTIAVIVILFFFINKLKYSLLTALSIPVSASFVLIILFLCDRSINSMSLSGLAMGIGLVSDNSVIMIDVLHRTYKSRISNLCLTKEIACAAAGISASSFASAVTTAIVFVPVIFLPGALGELFGDLSIAIVSAVFASWIFAQFALPSLFCLSCKKVYSGSKSSRFIDKKDGLKNHILISGLYKKLLCFSLRSPKFVFITAALLSMLGFILVLSRPAIFIPPDAAGEIVADVQFPAGLRSESIAKEALVLVEKLTRLDCLETVFALSGAEDDDRGRRTVDDYQKEKLVTRCILKHNTDPAFALGEIKSIVDSWAFASLYKLGTKVYFPPDKTERLLGLSSSNNFYIKGNSGEEAEFKAKSVLGKINEVANGTFSSLNRSPVGTIEKYLLYPKREIFALLGISSLDLAGIVLSSTEGILASRSELNGIPIDIRVSSQNDSLHGVGNLENLPVASTQNGILYLGTVADIVCEESYPVLSRLDRSDVIYINAVPKDNLVNISNTTRQLLHEIPELARVDESAFTRYKTSLIITVFLVILLLYLSIGAQFESFSIPLVFMLSILFALAGAGPALFLSGLALDCGSVLALLVLFGLVVNGSMVLYEACLEKINQGYSVVSAVFEGSQERLISVLVTTLTTIIVLFPPAFASLGAGQRSMAVTMIGSCIAVSILTLFVMPPLFILFLKRKKHHE